MKNFLHSANFSNRMISGMLILLFGIVFLLDNFNISMPHWLFSWSTFLLAAGVVVGIRKNFSGNAWLLMVFTGGYFTLSAITEFDLSSYFFPVAMITLGLYFIFKQQLRHKAQLG